MGSQRRLWIRIVVSAVVVGMIVALVVGVGNVRPAQVLQALRRIGPGAAVLTTLTVIAQMLLILTRLWFLFPSPRPSWLRVAYGFTLGQVVNNFLPVRSGDVIKVVIITGPPEAGRHAGETLGVLIADGCVDILALVALLLCVGPSDLPSLGGAGWLRLALIGGLAVAVLALVVCMRGNPRVRRVLLGMRLLRNPVKILGGLALSMGSWTAEFIALRALAGELGGHLGFADAIRVLFLFNLAIFFPVSVANLGTFEVPIAIGLRFAGLAFSAGLAIGAAYHGLQILGIMLLALVMVLVRRLLPMRR